MMTLKSLATITCFGLSLSVTAQSKQDTSKLISRPADVGLVYPISTNGVNAARYSNSFSLQAIAGVSGAITGCAIAGIANIIKGNARYTEIAGIVNLVGDQAKGVQFAGVVNSVRHQMTGLQVAGLMNTAGELKGVQIAGLENISRRGSQAVQIGGLMNKAQDVHTQMAGIVNIAKKVTGVQLSGLLNIADSSDYPIGVVNLIKSGEKSLGVSTDETLNTLVSFRSGGRVLYGILGLGYNFKSKYHPYLLETGIGAHLVKLSPSIRLNAEASQLAATDFKNGHSFTYSLRLLPEVKIADRIQLFVGPTANLVLDYSHEKMSGDVYHYLWTTTENHHDFIGSYVGLTGGINITL